MKKLSIFMCVMFLGLGAFGVAQANFLVNGDFETGTLDGWSTSGDVQIANTNVPIIGGFAEYQGMDNYYALLGLKADDYTSRLRQDFEICGVDKITVSFNWAFDFLDLSNSDDEFLALVRQDGKPAKRITLLDLVTNSIVGLNFGYYSETIDISEYVTDEARMIFRLIESPGFTFSAAGIDNVSVAPVPEPATMLLLGSGLVGLAGFRKRFRKK